MKRSIGWMVVSAVLCPSLVLAMGRKKDFEDNSVYEPPVRHGSAANPNPAFAPPVFGTSAYPHATNTRSVSASASPFTPEGKTQANTPPAAGGKSATPPANSSEAAMPDYPTTEPVLPVTTPATTPTSHPTSAAQPATSASPFDAPSPTNAPAPAAAPSNSASPFGTPTPPSPTPASPAPSATNSSATDLLDTPASNDAHPNAQ